MAWSSLVLVEAYAPTHSAQWQSDLAAGLTPSRTQTATSILLGGGA